MATAGIDDEATGRVDRRWRSCVGPQSVAAAALGHHARRTRDPRSSPPRRLTCRQQGVSANRHRGRPELPLPANDGCVSGIHRGETSMNIAWAMLALLWLAIVVFIIWAIASVISERR